MGDVEESSSDSDTERSHSIEKYKRTVCKGKGQLRFRAVVLDGHVTSFIITSTHDILLLFAPCANSHCTVLAFEI